MLATTCWPQHHPPPLHRTCTHCACPAARYSKEWEKTVKRLGRWIDFENDYKTLDPSFMESVWWVEKGGGGRLLSTRQ